MEKRRRRSAGGVFRAGAKDLAALERQPGGAEGDLRKTSDLRFSGGSERHESADRRGRTVQGDLRFQPERERGFPELSDAREQFRNDPRGAEDREQIFRPFYRTDEARDRESGGTGLGLALTRELVFLHGGNIECDSEEGKGTTFTVTLPINKESFTAAQIDESQKVDINTARSVILDLATRMKTTTEDSMPKPIENIDDDSYKLLVIEDNVELLMLMQQLLGQKYQVKTASNGQEGLDIINNNELDLIVSDVMMPVMDGYELTHRVKEDPNTSHLPIILLTAKTQEEDRVEALQIGADDYVTKPFKLHDLELRINNIIENRKRIQQEFSQQTAEETQEQVSAEPVSADQQFLKRALDCVYKHLDDADYDRDAFAADMGASASTLYNKLRSVTGMNVSGFIRDIRMKEAKRIALQQPDLRVSDLAYKVGFHDPKYFSTCFKKTYGVQPSEFLENLSKDQ